LSLKRQTPAIRLILPACPSTSAAQSEVQQNMQEAVEFHRDGLREEGYPIPQPLSASVYVEVARAA